MARYGTTNDSSFVGVFELDVLRDTAVSAGNLGVIRFRNREDAADDRFLSPTGTWVEVGHRFLRAADGYDGNDYTVFGDWKPWRPQGEPESDKQFYLIRGDQEVQVDAGENMKDPDGGVILVDGSTVAQPAVGEQARDAWTGELVFEEDGTTPVLVQ